MLVKDRFSIEIGLSVFINNLTFRVDNGRKLKHGFILRKTTQVINSTDLMEMESP